jgi:hypothetical protein
MGVHSGNDFAWGYLGSGPRQLAEQLLMHHFGEMPDRSAHREGRYQGFSLRHKFKEAFVARWKMDEPWELTTTQIERWLAEIGWKRKVWCPDCGAEMSATQAAGWVEPVYTCDICDLIMDAAGAVVRP